MQTTHPEITKPEFFTTLCVQIDNMALAYIWRPPCSLQRQALSVRRTEQCERSGKRSGAGGKPTSAEREREVVGARTRSGEPGIRAFIHSFIHIIRSVSKNNM